MSAWLLALAACADPLTVGDQAFDAGDMEIAVARWEGRELDDAARQQRYARALLRVGRPADAAAALSVVAPEHRDAQGHLVAGVLAAGEGQLELALQEFEAGLVVELLPELVVNRCVALRGLGRPALQACREAIRLAPEDPRGLLSLAEEGLSVGTPEIAAEALEAATPLLVDEPGARGWAASIAAQLGRWEQACALGRGAPDVGLEVARACAAAGQPEVARALAEPLVTVAPEATALLLRLSVDEAERAAPGAARSLAVDRAWRWARQLEGEPGVGELTDLGRLHALEGDEALAEARWREALTVSPEEVAPRLNLAELLMRRGASEAALALVDERAGLRSPDAVLLGLTRARWWVAGGETERAAAWLEEALPACRSWSNAPCESEVAYALAVLRAEQGRGAAALEHLEVAVRSGGPGLIVRASREPAFEPMRNESEWIALLSGP